MIDTDRILILGGAGMVGSGMHFGIKPSHAEADVTDADSLARAFKTHAPQAVINAAAYTDMVAAQKDPTNAERINVRGAANVAEVCAEASVPLVFFSTCTVFDGGKPAPYDENDPPHPLNMYGDTKFRGEQEVAQRAPGALIIRTGWLFGGERDTKFIRRFYERMKKGEPVRATSDRFGSPTYVPDLVAETMRLLQKGERGLFHVVNEGIASYFDVAQELKRIAGSPSSVIAASASELDPPGVPRGRMEGLISNRGIRLRPYADALAEYCGA